MAKSFVRINNHAKTAESPLYAKAVQEFVRKMGGPWAVINAISREMAEDNTLFDNTPTRMPTATAHEPEDAEEEDPIIARHGDAELPFARAM